MPDFPNRFVQTITAMYDAWGEAWLAALPALLDELAARWGLTLLPPFPNLSYNYAAPGVRRDGQPVVLKVGVPNRELLTEIEALWRYAGRGAVRLLDADPDLGALLLERLTPGTPLVDLADDEAATIIAAEVMQALWRPLPLDHPFPTVAQWAAGLGRLRAEFDGGTGPFPTALVETAEAAFAALVAEPAPPVLLHGDLHHWNILAAVHGWTSIDPKGLAGPPVYEVGAWLRNPIPTIATRSDARRVQQRRLALFAERLGFDREQMLDLAVAQAVLSGWWSYEDGEWPNATWLAIAETLDDIRRARD